MKAKFNQLFGWELANIPRRPLFWLMSALLAGAFIWGAINAGRLHAKQSAATEAAIAEDAAWYKQIDERVPGYRQPAQEPLRYWQDPTDIYGFSRYFLKEHAYRPHLPLSVLAVGQSDLLPYLMSMKLETVFAMETAYDFEPPRGLALGIFDLSFCVVYLLPIAVIILVTMLGAFERDHGILRLAAAQGVSPRMLIGARLLALITWFIPMVLVAMLLALAVAGAPLGEAVPEFATALAITAGYALIWFALGFLVLTLQQGAAVSASALVSAWAVFTIIIPLVAAFGTARFTSTEKSLAYVDEMRHVEGDMYTEEMALTQSWLDTRQEPTARQVVPENLPFAARLIFTTVEKERLLQDRYEAILEGRREAAEWTRPIQFFSPAVAMQSVLAGLAGTDSQRHHRYSRAVRSYQRELRDFIYPRIKAQILSPRETNCVGCGGKMTFTDFSKVPKYRYPAEADRAPFGLAMFSLLAFVAVGSVLFGFALVRGRMWRPGELD